MGFATIPRMFQVFQGAAITSYNVFGPVPKGHRVVGVRFLLTLSGNAGGGDSNYDIGLSQNEPSADATGWSNATKFVQGNYALHVDQNAPVEIFHPFELEPDDDQFRYLIFRLTCPAAVGSVIDGCIFVDLEAVR